MLIFKLQWCNFAYYFILKKYLTNIRYDRCNAIIRINEIIYFDCSIERESIETAQKPRESQDTSSKVLDLHKKLNLLREQVNP